MFSSGKAVLSKAARNKGKGQRGGDAQARLGQPHRSHDRPVLSCAWKLRNNGKEPVHVYFVVSSQFRRRSGPTSRGETLLLLTTWLGEQRNTHPAYDFPKPTFITLDSGTEVSGTLQRAVSTQRILTNRKIRLIVGYVTDLAQFRKDMENSLKQGIEFPANPIVRWQKVEYSAPVALQPR